MTIVAQTSIEHVTSPKILFTKVQWSLEDCRSLLRLTQKHFKSCNFTLTDSSQTAYLSFETLRITKEVQKGVLTLHLNECKQESLNLIVTASIVLKDNSKVVTETKVTRSHSKVYCLNLLSVDLPHIQENCIQNNILRFLCEVEDVKKVEAKKIDKTVTTGLSMVKNFDKFYKEEKFCDIIFLIGDKSIRAHSLVLAAVSPYFFNLFNEKKANNNEKDSENVINLTNDTNVTAESLRAFLDYVYGCKSLKELKTNMPELLIVANKFGVVELQNACTQMICDTFNEQNITSFLLFASKNNCNALKKDALKFAKSCLKAIVSSKHFQELCKDQSLMLELF